MFKTQERQTTETQIILKQAKVVANVNNLDFGGFKMVFIVHLERFETRWFAQTAG